MNELFANYAYLLTGFVVVSVVAAFSAVIIWLAVRNARYTASQFQTVGDVVDTVARKKEELKHLDQFLDAARQQIDTMSEKRALLDKLNAEITKSESDLLGMKDALDQANRLRSELTTLQMDVERAREMQMKLKASAEQLEQERQQKTKSLSDLKSKLDAMESDLNQARSDLGQCKAMALTAQAEQEHYKKLIAGLKADESKARIQTEQATSECAKVENRIKELRTEVLQLEQTKAKIPALAELFRMQNEVNRLEQNIEDKQKRLDEMNQAINEGKTAEQLATEASAKLQAIKIETSRLTDAKTEKEIQLRKLEERIEKVQGTLSTNYEDVSEQDLKKSPECVISDLKTSVNARVWPKPETDCLESFCQALKNSGYIFDRRTVYSFHTALKCQSINPLTVLAGVSGTGKTLLPIQYANFMGMLRLIISVQPRWDSPQDLFGFYNYLEHQYKATELSRLLWSYGEAYQNKQSLAQRMSLVLFDEMNLARTEYYFSDFLSKLELSRINPNDAKIQIDIPQKTHSLAVPKNILMVGTMNEDESTQTLSDKVLDRANVLRFGKPGSVVSLTTDFPKFEPSGYIVTLDIWNEWCRNASLLRRGEQIQRWIREINEAMERVGRPFGYRVQSAILEYVRRYPNAEVEYATAFADQIEQKILPKLRGVDVTGSEYKFCINSIRSIVDQTGDKKLLEAIDRSDRAAGDQGLFVWSGVTRA